MGGAATRIRLGKVTRRTVAIDAGVAALAFGLTVVVLAARGLGTPDPAARPLDGVGVLLAAASAMPLLAWRRVPLAVYVATSAAVITLVALDHPVDFPFGPVVALYALAVANSGDAPPLRRRAAMLAAGLFVPAATVAYLANGHPVRGSLPGLGFWALICAGVWITGERTRIARELHDSAGHAINVILVQAGAARLLHERDPEGSRRAIATVEQVARATIGEFDQLVRALREDDAPQAAVPTDPAALDQLLEHHRSSGLVLTTDVRGQDRSLPPTVTWAAYRILQEALTNAVRHGRGSAGVAVWYAPDAVEITVTNPTVNGSAPGGGHGIVGMRERASLLGGPVPDRPTQSLRSLAPGRPRAAPDDPAGWHSLRSRGSCGFSAALCPTVRLSGYAPSLPAGRGRRRMTGLRVLIADDDDLMRAGLRAVLSSDETVHVVAEAVDGYQAIEHARRFRPDVVLMDVRMPNLDGIAATRQLLAAVPQ